MTAKDIAKKKEESLLPAYKGETGLTETKIEDVSGSEFMPRLQLLTDAATLVKGDKFPKNHFGLFRSSDPEDLGKTVDIIVCTFRAKALDTSGDDVLESFDAKSALFDDIKRRSFEKDSGCMFGPEFLVYIPSKETFATFFASSKTARNDAPTVNAYKGKACTLGSRFIEGKSFSWWTWSVANCAVKLDGPDPEEFNKSMEEFLNPKKKEPEMVEKKADTGRR